MEKMDPTQEIDFMLYQYHSKPEILAAAKAIMDIHPDFVRFFRDKIPMERSQIVKRKELFMHDAADAMWYSVETGDLDLDVQEVLALSPHLAVGYASKLGKRLPGIEPRLLNFNLITKSEIIIKYVKEAVDDRWPELEDVLTNMAITDSYKRDTRNTILIEYAGYLFENNIKVPSKLMDIIKQSPRLVIDFTWETGVRHPELEPIIKADSNEWYPYFYTALRHTGTSQSEIDQLRRQWVADRLKDLNAERESLRDRIAKKGK